MSVAHAAGDDRHDVLAVEYDALAPPPGVLPAHVWLEERSEPSLLPRNPPERARALQLHGSSVMPAFPPPARALETNQRHVNARLAEGDQRQRGIVDTVVPAAVGILEAY